MFVDFHQKIAASVYIIIYKRKKKLLILNKPRRLWIFIGVINQLERFYIYIYFVQVYYMAKATNVKLLSTTRYFGI